VRKNPLLYSDQKEIEDLSTIEPIEEKRSFIFYLIVFANLILVIFVLLIIWLLLSKDPNTSFDQQLKSWTHQLFNTQEEINTKKKVTSPTPVEKKTPVKPKISEEEKVELEKARIDKERALEAEKAKLESLAIKLQEEKNKAAKIKQAADDTEKKSPLDEKPKIEEPDQAVSETTKEAAVVPNAAQNIQEQPKNTAKTQLEKILETMEAQ